MAKRAAGLRGILILAIMAALFMPLHCAAQNYTHKTDNRMSDEEQIKELYQKMCLAMIDKDTATLSSIHDDDFVLVHMTGMRQSKQQYIDAIADGTLNYFSARHDDLEATVTGDSATLLARSYVSAAVFGGGRHSWRLQLEFRLTRRDGQWQFSSCKASTY